MNLQQKTGYVSLVGRPNAGKSTLLNALLGQKIAGVSAKPQTTRNKILGIYNHGPNQILFLDTPGMHRLKRSAKLNSMMNKEAFSVVAESDLIVYLIDPIDLHIDRDIHYLTSIVKNSSCPIVVAMSKADKLKKRSLTQSAETLSQALADCREKLPEDRKPFLLDQLLSVSAKDKSYLPEFLDFVSQYIPQTPWLYPEDDLTDRPQKFVIAELIREKVFRSLGDEIPYQTAVRIDQLDFSGKTTKILATIVVARSSQKGMVIGKQGSKIRDIGTKSRLELEQHLQKPVYLDLQVKVDSGWIDNAGLIAEYSSLGEQP